MSGLILLALGTFIFTSLAYFTSFDQAKNKFTTGDINISIEEPNFISPDKMSPEELEELKDKWANEGLTSDQIEKKVQDHRNNAHLLPGKEVAKDPTITLDKDSEDTYIFAAVDNRLVNILDEIEIDDSWEEIFRLNHETDENRTLTIYSYKGKHASDKVILKDINEAKVLEALFEKIVVKEKINHDVLSIENLEKLNDNHVDVLGFAHQANINGEHKYDVAEEAAIKFFEEKFK